MEKKYYGLYINIKNRILNGEYRAGEKLPSKRVMAEMTGYSIITVQTAYGMLADEGYVEARERSGYFVLPLIGVVTKNKNIYESSVIYAPEDEDEAAVEFEYSVWFKTVRRVMADDGKKLFVKAPSKGCAVLRNAIADYLWRYRGMAVDANRIIIGSGAEQLYEIAVKILGRDKIFGIEDPCYERIPQVYEEMGVKVKRLKMGSDGIEDDCLNDDGFDILHVTPFHSYPSGVTATIQKRYKYLSWVKKERYVIEDDFDSEFFLPGQPIESLYSLDGGNSVIYMNTFSKSLSPAIRLGYMILPEGLLKIYNEKLGNFSCTVPVMEQHVLAEFIKEGDFERHLNRTRRRKKSMF